MRRRLVLLVLATTSLVVVAFLVPLALLVRSSAADRAVSAAAVDIQALAPLVAAGDVAALDAAVKAAPRRITVFLPDGHGGISRTIVMPGILPASWLRACAKCLPGVPTLATIVAGDRP